LLDQKVISGICNYLRADILYLSKINPFRKVKDITEKELKIIFKNSKILTWGDYDVKKELYEGSQKRFIYYVPKIQI
jgi:formamidopyrimidine-DNA glycosylase